MAGFDPYRFYVEFKVKDETIAGFSSLKKSVKDATAYTTALKKEIASIRAQSMVPASAIQARQRMLTLAKEEAGIRERLATTANLKERQVLETRLSAVKIAQREMSVQRQTLAFQESQAAAAQKTVTANAAVAAVQKNLADIRAMGIGQVAEINALRREELGLAKEEADIRTRLATTIDIAERAALQARLEALGLAKDELVVRRQQLAVDAADRREREKTIPKGFSGAKNLGAGMNQVGTNMIWTGGGILAGLGYATQKAANFDQTTFETDLALGGGSRSAAQRTADMKALKSAAFSASNATGFFDAQQIMDGLKVAATSGMRPIVEKYGMSSFTAVAPALAQFMDIQGRMKHEAASDAATQAIQLAHMFGAYKPDDMAKVWNQASILSLSMPDTFDRAITTMSQIAPVGKYLSGMNPADVMAFAATADQSGLGHGRAGARLKDYIQAISVTQSAKREAAKHALGLQGAIDANGNLDIAKSFDILIRDRQEMGAQRYRDLTTTAFGQVGVVVAGMFGNQSKVDMYRQNQKVINDSVKDGSLPVIQNLLKTFGLTGQEAVAFTRLSNDMIKFGEYGIPIATKFFDSVNPKLKEFGDWIDAHPKDAEKMFNDLVGIGGGLVAFGVGLKAVGTALAIPYGALKLYQALNAMKMARDIGLIAKSVKTLGAVDAAVEPAAASLASVGTVSAGTIGAVTGLIATVAGILYGVKWDSDHPMYSPTGMGQATDATMSNYGLGFASPDYEPWRPGKTTADLSQLKATVEFTVQRDVPAGSKGAVHIQSIMRSGPSTVKLPTPTVGGMMFGG